MGMFSIEQSADGAMQIGTHHVHMVRTAIKPFKCIWHLLFDHGINI